MTFDPVLPPRRSRALAHCHLASLRAAQYPPEDDYRVAPKDSIIECQAVAAEKPTQVSWSIRGGELSKSEAPKTRTR